MKKAMVFCFLLLAALLPPGKALAKVRFQGLDLSEDNRLLFQAGALNDGALPQNALFVSRLTDSTLRQLTVFPEKMDLLNKGSILQIRNAFGAVRLPVSGGLPRTIPGFPSFVSGAAVPGGRVEETAASPDGRWILSVENVSAAYGNLVLIDTETGDKSLIAFNAEKPDRYFPACWSPDSRVFVYCRAGKLYFHSIVSAGSQASSVDERYRLIGEGSINAVFWGGSGDFFFLKGSTLYRVRGSELFARALYAGFLEIGVIAGKIPFDFDCNFDAFWISPDSKSMIFSKGGRNIFYYPLEADDYSSALKTALPYVTVPRSCYNLSVLWSQAGPVAVIASIFNKNKQEVIAWRLEAGSGAGDMVFKALDTPPGSSAALSPDGSKVLFWGDTGVVLYDFINWRVLSTISVRPAFSCVWLNSEEFISGGEWRIERVRVDGTRSLLCLAAASEYGFEENGERILARNGGDWFATNGGDPWSAVPNPLVRSASLASSRYRVYLAGQVSGFYENLPMIRNTASVGTSPLLPAMEYPHDALSAQNENGSEGLITHGARGGTREVGLCFDLYDDVSGLSGVLDSLRRFGVKATFFLNGEFIRRYPSAAREIAEAGHEAASMFFTAIDLSDSRYLVGSDFIARGLARNEDEFHRASAHELSLLWHPPYYAASAEIAAAAGRAGYTTLGRDVDPLDWVSLDDARRLGLSQYSASDMIDRIMNIKRPGSIIPVRLGVLSGGRGDYLFLKIDVLLDALVRSGYSVVPVSTIIEHAK
jgi:peptidoglycan/xylan/chitin deacetylase (PgdA/CDA1 family)/WD40 repeat protein